MNAHTMTHHARIEVAVETRLALDMGRPLSLLDRDPAAVLWGMGAFLAAVHDRAQRLRFTVYPLPRGVE